MGMMSIQSGPTGLTETIAFLELVQNAPKYKAETERLQKLLKDVNASIKAHNEDLAKIEAAQNKAATDVRAAEKIRAEAIAAQVATEAAKTKLEGELADQRSKLTSAAAEQAKRELAQDQRENDLNLRARKVAVREKDVMDIEAKAHQIMTEFNAKRDALKALAA